VPAVATPAPAQTAIAERELVTQVTAWFRLGRPIAVKPVAEGLMNRNWQVITPAGTVAVKQVSAFQFGAPVAFGWMREQPGGPVRVLAAGSALMGGAGGGQVVLTLPAGARAQLLPPGQAPELLARMPCWMQLAGIADALLADHDDAGRQERDVRPSLEDGLLSAWSGPFAWLLLAEPVPAGPARRAHR
jgi:hypothetical protein